MKKIIIGCLIVTLFTIFTLETETQEKKVVKLGVLVTRGDDPNYMLVYQGLKEGLEESLGKENLKIDFQDMKAQAARGEEIVERFKKGKLDLILTIGTPASQAGVEKIKNIPLIFSCVAFPLEAGLVKDLVRPGGNATGMMALILVKEQLDLLQEIKPDIKRIGVPYNPTISNAVIAVKRAEEVAKRLNVEIIKIPVGRKEEVERAVNSMADRINALWMPPDPTIASAVIPLIKLSKEKRLPLMTVSGEGVREGALLSFAIDHYALGQKTSLLALKVLGGSKPGNLPVGSPKRAKLTLNLKTAREIGCRVASQFLAKVDELIE
jgi:putative ABC transport system substrate-binding protein